LDSRRKAHRYEHPSRINSNSAAWILFGILVTAASEGTPGPSGAECKEKILSLTSALH